MRYTTVSDMSSASSSTAAPSGTTTALRVIEPTLTSKETDEYPLLQGKSEPDSGSFLPGKLSLGTIVARLIRS